MSVIDTLPAIRKHVSCHFSFFQQTKRGGILVLLVRFFIEANTKLSEFLRLFVGVSELAESETSGAGLYFKS